MDPKRRAAVVAPMTTRLEGGMRWRSVRSANLQMNLEDP